MQIRRTKHQLIFTPVGIMGQLVFRWQQHFKTFGCYASRIYVSEKEYEEYKKTFDPALMSSPAFNNKLYFRGAEVIIKK